MSKQKISAEKFDSIFDEGKEDITQYLDLSTGRHINKTPQRVNTDFPSWMVVQLDQEADRLGVTRQSLIKIWIAEKLEERAKRN